jgi:hypothetical protein
MAVRTINVESDWSSHDLRILLASGFSLFLFSSFDIIF